ncbi:probable E3 ubiquitin-protein ligase RHA1A [Scaptodrosophila lebanonensis]|uniref:Probable E3 ubiquitin-protein ligase RHA1A n=1 Tax=Drosophila lebanonensis TaxID=7225 RepID=A0A6J2U117_DROLE|nr:probable E3 ubiquitin-protein ligase RHA1A [Scaptodrosophila lebanonensis]XP_030381594.1 probable E3 ubiquitin-protein ligase RHA1A [Scaptodrosophila lebanonensis]XP_030381595.1 probable E3 ubiquitin-protein ligase RHA1A [Scaptodrosophila lebanonensis]
MSASEKGVCCTICSERYMAADEIHAGTCGHVFHWQCLKRWFDESSTKRCPICRCSSSTYFKIFLDFEDKGSGADRQSSSTSSESSTSSLRRPRNTELAEPPANVMSEYENLLYETGLYRDEIEYLNSRIADLMERINLDD